jgi:hypothetical protein
MASNIYDVSSKDITLENLQQIVTPLYVAESLGYWANYNESVGGLESFLVDETAFKTKVYELSNEAEIGNNIASLYDTEYKAVNIVKKDGHEHKHFSRLSISKLRAEQNISVAQLVNPYNQILSKMAHYWDKTALNGDGTNKGLFTGVTPLAGIADPTTKDIVDFIIEQAFSLNRLVNYDDTSPVLVIVSGAKTQGLINSPMYDTYNTVASIVAGYSWLNVWKLSSNVSTDEFVAIVKPQETKLFWSVSPTITRTATVLDANGFDVRATHFGDCSNSIYKRSNEVVVKQPFTYS